MFEFMESITIAQWYMIFAGCMAFAVLGLIYVIHEVRAIIKEEKYGR